MGGALVLDLPRWAWPWRVGEVAVAAATRVCFKPGRGAVLLT